MARVCPDADSVCGTSTILDGFRGCTTTTATPKPALHPGMPVRAGTMKAWLVLRHTFCSHLAMRGAVPKAIQELAGHQSLTTTQGYMHLSPAAKSAAIELLNRAVAGDIVETAQGSVRNP